MNLCSLRKIGLRQRRIEAQDAFGQPIAFFMVCGQEVISQVDRDEWRKLMLARDPFCRYCRKAVHERTSTIDHLMPLSKGGPPLESNLVLACRRCNDFKADFSPPEFLELLERVAANLRLLI